MCNFLSATLKNNSMFKLVLVQIAHVKSRCRAFCVTALKHSPSKRKSISRPLRPLEGDFDSTGESDAFQFVFRFPVTQKFSALVYHISREIMKSIFGRSLMLDREQSCRE